MDIVVNQTSKNILTISFALILGGINTLYFYPEFLLDFILLKSLVKLRIWLIKLLIIRFLLPV